MQNISRYITEIKKRLKSAIEREASIATAYHFGSFGTPYFNTESDVDVGLLFFPTNPPDIRKVIEIQERLSTATGRGVDVVFLNQASSIIAMQILRHGQKLVERDAQITNDFFVRTINLYFDLKSVRRPVEQNILSGKLYGVHT